MTAKTMIDEAIEVLEKFPVKRLAPASCFETTVDGVLCLCPAMILAEHFGIGPRPRRGILGTLGIALSPPDTGVVPANLETWVWDTIVCPYDRAYDRELFRLVKMSGRFTSLTFARFLQADIEDDFDEFRDQAREAGRKATIEALRKSKRAA